MLCGHACPNFFNRSEAVERALLQRPRFPFELRWLDGRMVVTHSAEIAAVMEHITAAHKLTDGFSPAL